MLLRLVFKHTVATTVIVVATLALAVVSYFGLLIWAIPADSGIGGPLALPFMMLAGVLGALAACSLVFFPATIVAELVRRRSKLRFVWEIPLAAVSSALLCLLFVWIVRRPRDGGLAGNSALVWASLAVPLGAYWWSAQAADLVWFGALYAWRWAVGHLRAKPPNLASAIGNSSSVPSA
jgi:hypothetical protein